MLNPAGFYHSIAKRTLTHNKLITNTANMENPYSVYRFSEKKFTEEGETSWKSFCKKFKLIIYPGFVEKRNCPVLHCHPFSFFLPGYRNASNFVSAGISLQPFGHLYTLGYRNFLFLYVWDFMVPIFLHLWDSASISFVLLFFQFYAILCFQA